MIQPRIIPVLLIKNGMLYKGKSFGRYRYVGDPMNAIKIFNELEVDELIVIDIDATEKGRAIELDLVRGLAAEAFMPLAVGGGISSIAEARALLASGVEKIIVNTSAIKRPQLINELALEFGSQSIVACIDIKKTRFSNKKVVYSHCGKKKSRLLPVEWAVELERLGAGEIMVNSVDCDGSGAGYDVDILNAVCNEIKVPVIAAGGAGHFDDFKRAIDSGCSAAAAGSMFVFHGPRQAVLISYPYRELIDQTFPPIVNFN